MRSPGVLVRSSFARRPPRPVSASAGDLVEGSTPRDLGEASSRRAAAASRHAAASRPRADTAPAWRRPGAVADAVRMVAGLSLAAGAIHALAMIDHFAHYWLYGVFFLVLTYGQVLWGLALLRRPVGERSLAIGALANLAIVAVWVVSRTVGVPLGPDAGRPEAVGAMDVAATLDQLVLAAYVAAILRPRLRDARGFKALMGRHRVRIGTALCSASVFAALLGSHHHH
jgi:hypothetical protein